MYVPGVEGAAISRRAQVVGDCGGILRAEGISGVCPLRW